MKPQYYILDPEAPGENLDSISATGPFQSIKAAEDWLRNDCKSLFEDCETTPNEHDPETWTEPVHIVQLVKTVQQCPEVKVTVRLKEVKQ